MAVGFVGLLPAASSVGCRRRVLDPNLTALAQLGALRLNTERSFFSLIDGSTQYVVAEATQTTSLSGGSDGRSQEDLMLGRLTLDKDWGV